MALIILLIAAIVIGYFLARSRYSAKIDETAEKVSSTSRSWTERAGGWVNTRILKRTSADPFREWVAGPGATSLPDDFKDWLAGLSEQEAADFTRALDKYADSLDFSLTELVKGDYDGKPALVQVFVEAIVIYSQEYRKAREVQQSEAETDNNDEEPAGEAVDEKKVAEKSASRRKQATAETS